MKSGKYKVILLNRVNNEILVLLSRMISGELAQRNLTPLKGKVGESIGSELLNVYDESYVEGSPVNRPFD